MLMILYIRRNILCGVLFCLSKVVNHLAKEMKTMVLSLKRSFFVLLMIAALAIVLPSCAQDAQTFQGMEAPGNAVWLDSLNLSFVRQGYGSPHAGRSVDDNPITLDGVVYPHGVGTHAVSYMNIDLHGDATKFVSMVGVDDEKKGSDGSVVFFVYLDGKQVFKTPVMHPGEAPKMVSVDLTGAKHMQLKVGDANNGIDSDHADWAGALIYLVSDAKTKPNSIMPETPSSGPARMIIPAANPHPEIHSPLITGATPGKPFLFLIAASGTRPFTYSTTKLPSGLVLNPKTGIISGSLKESGKWTVKLTVKGADGKTTRPLTIVGGEHKLALTPPMGWNSWNVWAGAIDQKKMEAAADAFIKTGLAQHGYQYVNIDDTWEDGRDAEGRILANKKFPDMKAMCEYIHSLGLKAGIYSSPGPKTCAGFEACYQHELSDAQSYAAWGFDYLKYDWCSYGQIAHGDNSLAMLQKPYILMHQMLDKVDRDILFSLCQYGMGDVWKWGAQVGGNCWRTTGDINDSWGSMNANYEAETNIAQYAGPGHWNDPDMLVLGMVGWGNPHPTGLTPNEQILHFSMWCMLSSPLLIGCDLTRLDPYTLAILTNDEAIAINQDPMGKEASKVFHDQNGREVWARPLSDGTEAALLVNTSDDAPLKVTVTWQELGLKGKQPVRDLWLHKNVGVFGDSYTVEVPIHGGVLLKIGKPHAL
jgi:alpha-galactosidase